MASEIPVSCVSFVLQNWRNSYAIPTCVSSWITWVELFEVCLLYAISRGLDGLRPNNLYCKLFYIGSDVDNRLAASHLTVEERPIEVGQLDV